MKIWIISSNRWNSAVTEYALSSAQALKQRGHDLLFTPLIDSPAERRGRALGLTTKPLATFSSTRLRSFYRLAREFRPEVVFTFGGPETFLSRFSGARVVRVRGVDFDQEAWLAGLKQRLSHSHVSTIVTPSRMLAEKLRPICRQKPVVPVVLGCDTEKFKRCAPTFKKRPYALIFGRFDPVKGHEQFLKVWRHVRSIVPNATLRIVGEPANVSVDQIRFWAQREKLIVGRDLELISARVSNVAELLSAATLGVIPSLGSEMIGRVAEEFLLCGTPVLVSGVGSLEELIFDPMAGASWRGLKDDEIAALIADWFVRAAEESEAAKIDRANRALELFSLESMGRHLEQIAVSCQ